MTDSSGVNGRWTLAFVIVIVGFNSLVFQSLLLREFFSVFQDNELVLGIFLGCWLLWPAIGSGGLGRFIFKIKNRGATLVASQIVVFFLLPLILFFVRSSRFFLHIPPGEEVGVLPMLSWISLVTIPFGLTHGFQFALVSTLSSDRVGDVSRGVSWAYISDTVGDLLGGAAFGYILVNVFSSFLTVAVGMGLVLVSLLLVGRAYNINRRWNIGFGILAITWFFTILRADKINEFASSLSWQKFKVIQTGSSKYGQYVITESEDLYSFFQNGGWLYSYPLRLPAEEIVYFTLTQTKNPKRVLMIGSDPQVLTEVLSYPVERIFWIELDPVALDLTKKIVTGIDEKAIANPRVRIVNTDGRFFINRYRGEKFDAVILNTANPTTLTANRFYTREFFSRVKNIMNHDGVIFLKLSSGENYLSDEKKGFNGSIYYALKQSFPYVLLIPGEELLLIGSGEKGYLSDNPDTISQRLKSENIKPTYVDESYIPFRVYPQRLTWIQDMLSSLKGVKINQDDKPVSSYYYLTLWGSKSSQGLRAFFQLLSKVRFLWLVIVSLLLGVLVAVLRIRKMRFVPVAVFIAGMTGMALEIVLILSFQTTFGYIYHLIGVVIGAFMAGILAGSLLTRRLFFRIKNGFRLLGFIILGSGFYAFLVPILIIIIKPVSGEFEIGLITKVIFPVLNGIAGFSIGIVFPLANHIYSQENRYNVSKVAGMLYASDLLGGMVGALLSSLFLLPLFGITQTCLFLALVNLIGSGLIFSGR